MSDSPQEFAHFYSLNADWRQQFVAYEGVKIQDENMFYFDKGQGGSSCFLEILPDMSVIVIDSILTEPFRFTRIPHDDDFWIVYYDLSENFSKHIVADINHKIGYKSKLNFAIVDNKIGSSYISTPGERFSLRLFIRKSYIRTFFIDSEFKKDFKDIFDDENNKMYFYSHIDSRSKVILHSLKQHKIGEPNFKFLLKGAAYILFGYLIERLNTKMPSIGRYLEKDIGAVMLSQQHLLSNLLIPFPGIDFLANIANMSATKYRDIYATIFGMTPALFFKNEKMLLAKELLESGDFKLISDVAYELGYHKTTYFSTIYKEYFGVLPNTVLK